jgi:signal transduction histidine kinase
MPEEPARKFAIPPLPHWAMVAFIARCGRRILPLYENSAYEPASQRTAVSQAIKLAEDRAKAGGEIGLDDVPQVGEQHFDHYDLDALADALRGAARAADYTHQDNPESWAAVNLAATCLAVLAHEVAFGIPVYTRNASDPEIPAQFTDLDKKAEVAINWCVFADKATEGAVLDDLERIHILAGKENWNTRTDVGPSQFGPMWPKGTPVGWPSPNLSFRPRARIIRTIGDKLISGPEAAVIELIKNGHDADASFVKIKFVPPLVPGGGTIVVEDDGHGMTLEDIQQRWMEPATTDKRDRRLSPKGRRLLGSKGIGRFASARLGHLLRLTSTAEIIPAKEGNPALRETSRISNIDWNVFESAEYLDQISFPVTSLEPASNTGTELTIAGLRDQWPEYQVRRLHAELRRLVSPIRVADATQFRIFLDLSLCTLENCGFEGTELITGEGAEHGVKPEITWEILPFPLLDVSDYSVDGAFDEAGAFTGKMIIRRGNLEPESISLEVPLRAEDGEQSCGIVLVNLNIFDREASAVMQTAEKAGFGSIGVREARKLLDSVSGVAIYREGFRIRPYGDGENDWLTLDAKRVQNPTLKIGRNQISGLIMIDDEDSSHLIERSSREGFEEGRSFRRLHRLISTLLAEVVEPRRRQFRIGAGLEERKESDFREIYRRVQMGWSKLLLAKIPEADRDAAEALIAKESERLTVYLQRLEERQAKLEAQVTLGQIVGEVMHQGNTPLSFIENESARFSRYWPLLSANRREADAYRERVPAMVNGMISSAGKLRALFDALSPLSGARRGEPKSYNPVSLIRETHFLFESRLQKHNIAFVLEVHSAQNVFGYPDDLATAAANLFENAIYWLDHHHVDRPQIIVTFSAEDDECKIRISDNGKGIPAAFAEQIFEVGFTLKPHGTGLGLSIAHEAISRSSGTLELLASDIGAEFRISLPLASQDEP